MMTITREKMEELLAGTQGAVDLAVASQRITDAGVGNTWLGHCLLYEHPDAAWIAWRQECAPGETQEESVRQLRQMGIFPEVA